MEGAGHVLHVDHSRCLYGTRVIRELARISRNASTVSNDFTDKICVSRYGGRLECHRSGTVLGHLFRRQSSRRLVKLSHHTFEVDGEGLLAKMEEAKEARQSLGLETKGRDVS